MRLLGFDITRKAKPPADARQVGNGGWYGASWNSLGRIMEPFTGAWQRNIEAECCENLLKFSAVYACVGLISDDISKLRIKLVQRNASDIWTETASAAFSPVLRKPNRYQSRIQFLSQWIVSKLLWGNAYILKERDQRNVVTALYVLDPARVVPMVTPEGAVWYRLNDDRLAQVPRAPEAQVMVPASEIIHDRMLTLFHPLVGVSPIYACGSSATQGIRIQANSEQFFSNMSRPSGVLIFPREMSPEEQANTKKAWQDSYGGGNIGRVAVIAGAPVGTVMPKYEQMTIPAHDAQLIEQLRWTVEDVARCFHVPLHKLGVGQPTLNNISALNQDYYTQTLQALIESVEVLLDEGLALPPELGTELDIESLLRMDPLTQADVSEKGIRGGWLAPNEARFSNNLQPVEGGDTPYMQQQNFSLAALNQRPPPGTQPAPAPALPAPEAKPTAAALEALLRKAMA
jgi:HK97 family phage portal protein